MSFPCGRERMCNDCRDLRPEKALTVCKSVGQVVGLPQPEDLEYEQMHTLTYESMLEIVGDDGYVSMEMREAAAEAAYELIVNKL